MSIRILNDREQGMSCLYCSTTMWAFGGIFRKGEDAENFLFWYDKNSIEGKDLRQLTDDEIESKINEWRREKIRISKNCYKGMPITDPNELIRLALSKGSVYHKNWKIKPAAFLIGMQFSIILRMINNKELFYVINTKNQTNDNN